MARETMRLWGEDAEKFRSALKKYRGKDIEKYDEKKLGKVATYATYTIGTAVFTTLYNKLTEKYVSNITLILEGKDDEIKEARDKLKKIFGIEFRLKEEIEESKKEWYKQMREKHEELEKMISKGV